MVFHLRGLAALCEVNVLYPQTHLPRRRQGSSPIDADSQPRRARRRRRSIATRIDTDGHGFSAQRGVIQSSMGRPPAAGIFRFRPIAWQEGPPASGHNALRFPHDASRNPLHERRSLRPPSCLSLITYHLSLCSHHFGLAGFARVCHNTVRQAPLTKLRQVDWWPPRAGQMW